MAKMKVGGTSKTTLDEFVHRFPAGAAIFREGDPAREMFIIQSGSVSVSVTVGGQDRKLAVLEKGDFFGEMAILEDYPERSATVTAVTDVEVLALRATDLDEMLQRRPWIAVRMMAKLSERLREANRRLEELSASQAEVVELPPPQSSQGVVARAVLFHEASHRLFGLKDDGETSLGRHDPVTGVTPDIDLTELDPDRTVSRRHAAVRAENGGWTVVETNAGTNGTFLNGAKIDPFKVYPVEDGDLVQLALVPLRMRLLAGGG